MTSYEDATRAHPSDQPDRSSATAGGCRDDAGIPASPAGPADPADTKTGPPEPRHGRVARLLRNQRPALREFQENVKIMSEIRDAHPWLPPLLGRIWRRFSSAVAVIVTVLFALPTIGDVRTSPDPLSGATATAVAENWQTYLFVAMILRMLWVRRLRR